VATLEAISAEIVVAKNGHLLLVGQGFEMRANI
jgi:hypothetical protein